MNMSNDVVSRKDVPFGVQNTTFHISIPLNKTNANFGQLLTRLRQFGVKKALTISMLMNTGTDKKLSDRRKSHASTVKTDMTL